MCFSYSLRDMMLSPGNCVEGACRGGVSEITTDSGCSGFCSSELLDILSADDPLPQLIQLFLSHSIASCQLPRRFSKNRPRILANRYDTRLAACGRRVIDYFVNIDSFSISFSGISDLPDHLPGFALSADGGDLTNRT